MSYTKVSGILLVVLLLASGCAKVGPDFVKPEANTMPQWLEAEGYQQVTTKAREKGFHNAEKRLDTVLPRLNHLFNVTIVETGKYKKGDVLTKGDR